MKIDNGTNEIDLKQAFSKLNTHFINQKKKYQFFLILTVIFATIIFFLIKTKYKANFALTSHCFSISRINLPISNLQTMLEEGNYELIAPRLNVPVEVAKSIKKISVEIVADDNLSSTTKAIYRGAICDITITTTDSSNIMNIKNGLLNYVISSPYIKNVVKLENISNDTLEHQMQRELKSLDSLNKLSLNRLSSSKNGQIILMEDLSSTKKAMFELEAKIVDMKHNTKLIKDGLWEVNEIIVIKSSTIEKIFKSFFAGSFLSILFIVAISLFKRK